VGEQKRSIEKTHNFEKLNFIKVGGHASDSFIAAPKIISIKITAEKFPQ
jgi:hypothetical protein